MTLHKIAPLLALLAVGYQSCTYPEKIKDGKTAYERRQYAVATQMLPAEYNRAKTSQEKAERAYWLGESYRRLSQPDKAAEWFNKATDHRYGKDEALQLARMYQQLQRYDEAGKAFQSAGRNLGDVNYYREQIIACKNAKLWLSKADSSLYSVRSLPLNTPATDFSPSMHGKEQFIFSSDREQSEGKDKYKWTNKKFFDLYTYSLQDSSVKRWESTLNQKYHQGNPSFNRDGTEVYFTQCGSDDKEPIDYCRIMVARKSGDQWATPTLVRLGEPQANYVHPHLVELPNGGKMLYFASSSKSGYGGYDIYASVWVEAEQKWAAPRNLGSTINSKGNDVFPYMDADTLYFASEGHPGMGGLDIFRAERVPSSGTWRDLQNLKAPVNSGGDDFGLIMDAYTPKPDTTILQIGYFTSNREGGKGSDDIYKFFKKMPPIPAKIDTPPAVDTVPKIVLQIRLDGLVKEKIYSNPTNPNSAVTGYNNLLGASVQVSTEDTVFTMGTESNGDFHLVLRTNTDYTFKATKDGYFTKETRLSTKGIVLTEQHPDTLLTTEIILDKIFTNQEIVLENIYYDYDKSNIREDAKPALHDLIELLKKNPQIRIQLASHTDCRGTTSYNESLSQRRAESVVLYLSENGIAPERLVARGFGESRPANTCRCETCTEEQHQQNRRTTFMVLE